MKVTLVALLAVLACQAILAAAAVRKASFSKGPFMKEWIANAKKKFGSKAIPGSNPKKPVTYNNISQAISSAGDATNIPFFVALDVGDKVCGGVLIHEKYAITVSGCTYVLNRDESFTAVFGYNDDGQATNRQTVTIKADEYWYPPDFDIASAGQLGWVTLIKINTPLTINNYVKPILVNPDDYEFPGFSVSYSGLGSTATTSLVLPSKVQEKQAVIAKQDDCAAAIQDYERDLYMCIPTGAEASGPCINDEGGPLYYYDSGAGIDVLIGLVSDHSWGFNYCPPANTMATFTRIFKFMCWMEEQSNNELVISKPGQCPAPADCEEKRRLYARRMNTKIPKTPKTPAKAKPKKN